MIIKKKRMRSGRTQGTREPEMTNEKYIDIYAPTSLSLSLASPFFSSSAFLSASVSSLSRARLLSLFLGIIARRHSHAARALAIARRESATRERARATLTRKNCFSPARFCLRDVASLLCIIYAFSLYLSRTCFT